MKLIPILSVAILVATAGAQAAPGNSAITVESAYQTHKFTLGTRSQTPGEMSWNGSSLSGIVAQFLSAPNPLQLVNPAAPESYGYGEQNVSYEPVTHRPMGLKLFVINF